jgi:hypothetical protein
MKYNKGDLVKYYGEFMLITDVRIDNSYGFSSTLYVMYNLSSSHSLKYHEYPTSHIDHYASELG